MAASQSDGNIVTGNIMFVLGVDSHNDMGDLQLDWVARHRLEKPEEETVMTIDRFWPEFQARIDRHYLVNSVWLRLALLVSLLQFSWVAEFGVSWLGGEGGCYLQPNVDLNHLSPAWWEQALSWSQVRVVEPRGRSGRGRGRPSLFFPIPSRLRCSCLEPPKKACSQTEPCIYQSVTEHFFLGVIRSYMVCCSALLTARP